MKVLFFIISISILFTTCKKKEEIDFSQYKASAFLLGTAWQASKVEFDLEVNNTLGFGISKSNENNELRHQISLQNLTVSKDTIFLKYWNPGPNWVTAPIVPTASFATFLSHGDVLGESYHLLEDKNFKSWVILNQVSEDEISGKFQIAFVMDFRTSPLRNPLPDSIYFTEGSFFARRK